MKSYQIAIARMLAFCLMIVAVHWVERFAPLYFMAIAAAAGVMLLSTVMPIPGLPCLTPLETSNRLAIWLVLVALAVLGFLHNGNTWLADGFFYRPQDVARWKTELILGISLAVPLVHWLAGVLLPAVVSMDGRRFATEFALYVNFSGIALVLWSGDAALTLSTLGAALALMVLAELTLYASR